MEEFKFEMLTITCAFNGEVATANIPTSMVVMELEFGTALAAVMIGGGKVGCCGLIISGLMAPEINAWIPGVANAMRVLWSVGEATTKT